MIFVQAELYNWKINKPCRTDDSHLTTFEYLMGISKTNKGKTVC
jgi:hypothetical protein